MLVAPEHDATPPPKRFPIATGFILACLAAAGCGSSGDVSVHQVTGSYQNLMAIGRAYFQATNRLDRPPLRTDDLMPELKKQGDPAILLRSPDDGQDYKILWGVDGRKIRGPASDYPVIAYEQQGKDGKRYVLQFRQVAHLTDEEFKKAPFPPGHRPPN